MVDETTEAQVGEVAIPEKKCAFLILGVTNRDTKALAKQVLALMEHDTGGRCVRLSEEGLIYDYVNTENLHPLCRKEWLKPTKNKVIVDLLEKTEKYVEDSYVLGIVIDGPFLVDKETRLEVSGILEEQGYDVQVAGATSRWISVMLEGYNRGENIKSLFDTWMSFNEQFSRTYYPDQSLPKAVIVDIGFLKNSDQPGYATAIQMLSSLQESHQIIVLADEDTDTPNVPGIKIDKRFEGESKLDIFWSKLAYHYDVTMVLEGSAHDAFEWNRIGVPCMSLVCQLALEKMP